MARSCLSFRRVFSRRRSAVVWAVLAVAFQPQLLWPSPHNVSFSQSAQRVEAYDFVEISLNVEKPDAVNPFTEVTVHGWFAPDGGEKTTVSGFCDAADGAVFRIRFMPSESGEYRYGVAYEQEDYQRTHTGRFTARNAKRKGVVGVDPKHPWHFICKGSGEHFFYNGTTTYFLAGWHEEQIRQNLTRLAGLKVNRVRAAIAGRVKNGRAWFEHVYPTEQFSFLLNPWVAERPGSVESPGFDVTRFNVSYWRRWESLLRHARDLNVVVSVIFYVDGRRPGVDPFGKRGMGGPDERRYYRYAVSRFAAFSNVMWDVTNEYRLFRNDAWAEKMGTFIKEHDPYDHLISVHGHGDFRFQTSPWTGFAMYQRWDEAGGYAFMIGNRQKQAATGRIIPQVNEEYGYEDHYPTWGANRKAPARSADSRRRLAWEIYMAGCYQTSGERADTGTGWGSDTGGGWLNGRGDDDMTMLVGYGHIVDFFTSIAWWELNPDNSFFTMPAGTSVKNDLTHAVYTRDKSGRATLYVDGRKQATKTVAGDCSNWSAEYRLALANELTRDRPWLGELYRLAIHDRALDEKQVVASLEAGHDATAGSPVVLYDFDRGQGDTVNDVSGVGKPLNLRIRNLASIRWLPSRGLGIKVPVLIASNDPATKITNAVRRSGEMTVEVWMKPANTTQTGPARIVTISKDPSQRNCTLGQKAGAYEMRFRTTSTSSNGEPALSTPGGEDDRTMPCGLRNKSGDLAVIYFPAGGAVTVVDGALANNLKARWYNPRNGRWAPTSASAKTTFAAPDKNDWVLLFRKDD